MIEALEWAADYADRNKIFESPANSRGYGHDKWTPPSAEEKRAIITQIAKDACDEGPDPHLKFLRNVLHNLGEARVETISRPEEAAAHLESIYQAVRRHMERVDK